MQRYGAAIRAWFHDHRRSAIALFVLIAVVALHPVILRLLARPLQSADPLDASTYFCLHGGELGVDGFKALDRAATWQRETQGTLLLIVPRANRLVEIGAVPSFDQTCRRELTNRKVPDGKIELIAADARSSWDEARGLGDWLNRHPQDTITLACSPFAAGRLRYVLDKVIDPRNRARVRLAPFYDPKSDATAWWLTRGGVKDFMYAWLDLAYTWCAGDDKPFNEPSAAEFKKSVAAEIGEAPR